MTAHTTSVTVADADPEDVEVSCVETHAWVDIGDQVGIWPDTSMPLEAQLTRLAEIGDTIHQQALAELTRLVNARNLAAVSDA